jgi:ketosteroid isomerase-like protein
MNTCIPANRQTLIPALFATMALLAANTAQARSADQQAVRCVEIAFSQTVENQDPAAFSAMLDPDTRFISSTVLHGPEEVSAAWAGFFAENGPRLKWRPHVVEVTASGDLALSRGPYRMRGQNEQGEPLESWGVYNSVWRRNAAGEWKILFDAGNPGEHQLSEEMKALIDQPVTDC